MYLKKKKKKKGNAEEVYEILRKLFKFKIYQIYILY